MARLARRPGRLAVLASGSGTNLQAILAAGLPVSLVLTDRACRAGEIARAADVPAITVDRLGFGYAPRAAWDRAGFTSRITAELQRHDVTLVAMAGFMTIFSPGIFDNFAGRIINTHPSLLPAFKGEHAVRDALAAGVPETGVSIHFATPELDSGQVIAQAKVPVIPGDTVDALWERIKVTERRLYPAVLRQLLEA